MRRRRAARGPGPRPGGRRSRSSAGNNGAEILLFRTYLSRYRRLDFNIPALIPQVYLHYDPYTRRERGSDNSPLARQRMDFLLLYSDRHRVVLEVDGHQHYADSGGRADPWRYAQMVTEDRRLRLAGYEMYRFGGHELAGDRAAAMLTSFFNDLHDKLA